MSIKIDLKIFLFALIYIITKQIKIYTILMLFAFVHELGHLIIGMLLGFKPISINITPYGLQIEFKVLCEEYNRKVDKGTILCVKRAIIALAGPLTNIAIIFFTLLITKGNMEKSLIIIYSNALIGIFNFIPIYPLDGGRIIKEILHIKFGLHKSRDYINKISNITVVILTAISSIVILYIHNIAILIIITYLWYLVVLENKKHKLQKNTIKGLQNAKNMMS